MEDVRVCPECQQVRRLEHFFHFENCYKCLYRKKLSQAPAPKKSCKICKDEIQTSGRWVYCSEPCAKEGFEEKRRSNWRNAIKSPLTQRMKKRRFLISYF